MGETVKRIIADNPDMQPGDVFVTNDPYRGGSHLPDVTVVTPVHSRGRRAALLHRQPGPPRRDRRHHARLDAAVLEESGRRRRADPQLQAGRRAAVRDSTSCASCSHRVRYPSRSPDTNLADITAQVAANQQGALDLRRMIDRYIAAGRPGLHAAYPGRRRAEDAAGARPVAARPATHSSTHLDDGTPIRVAITIDGRSGDDRLHRHRAACLAPATSTPTGRSSPPP